MDSTKNKETLSGFLKIFIPILFWNGLLYFFLRNKLPEVTDLVNSYSPLAVNMLSGKGYSLEGVFCTHFPPLFPLVLALFYKFSGVWGPQNTIYPVAVFVIQSLSCMVLYKLAYQIISKRTAIIIAWLLASYPFFIVLSATKYAWNTMPLALFFFIASVGCFLSGLNQKKAAIFFTSGFLLGLAGLTWAGFAYAPALFLFYMLRWYAKEIKIWTFSFLFVLGFLLPVLSWSSYASYKTGKVIFVSSATDATLIDGLVRHDYSKLRSFATVQRAKEQRERGGIESSHDVLVFYAKEIKGHPVDFVRWGLYKASRAWYGTDSEKHECINLLVQTPYILLGFYGFFLFVKEKKIEWWLILGGVLYFWALSFFVLTTIRYMMPAFMLWMIFVGYGLHSILKRFRWAN